ncbi:DUF599 family protein [Lentilitoribacter sp. Alg239-R112]|uniref:DUF599 domain-containing protein n=1 Tax=Lentilitoribacter sp. Alg239-R112 TaxID=2305987 RepID=UPI0013A6997E|nr:DUF599 family protein [Lentilitoribacter sp. Alg239-R112]
MTTLDIIAATYFIFCWFGFSIFLRYGLFSKRPSLSDAMDKHRKNWFVTASHRELRMIDTSIVAGLQSGVGFFASATILAIGGCVAALGAADQVTSVFSEIPLTQDADILVIEFKLLGLIFVLGYSFFKFGWSYRLFNYCGILLGAIPAKRDDNNGEIADNYARKGGEMNILAARHFTAGMRGIFLSVGYLGWFIGPKFLIITTTLILFVFVRRQYFSAARNVAMGDLFKEK